MCEINRLKMEDNIIKIIEQIQKSIHEILFIEVNKKMNLIDEGIMDSLMMAELVNRIEEEYNTIIDVDDLVPENFVSVNSIVEMIINNKEESR